MKPPQKVGAPLSKLCAMDINRLLGAGKTQRNLFVDYSGSGETLVRNRECWVSGIDMTCISPWNSTQGRHRGGVLIGRRHAMFAAHYPIGVGATVRFVSHTNQVVDRVVVSTRIHPRYMEYILFDVQIAEFDRNVDASIRPARLLGNELLKTIASSRICNGADITTYWNVDGMPVLFTDAEEKCSLTSLWIITHRADKGITTFVTFPPSNPLWKPFYEEVVLGDSGNPLFLVARNTMILLGLFTFASVGLLIGREIDWLRSEGVHDVQEAKVVDVLQPCPATDSRAFPIAVPDDGETGETIGRTERTVGQQHNACAQK